MKLTFGRQRIEGSELLIEEFEHGFVVSQATEDGWSVQRASGLLAGAVLFGAAIGVFFLSDNSFGSAPLLTKMITFGLAAPLGWLFVYSVRQNWRHILTVNLREQALRHEMVNQKGRRGSGRTLAFNDVKGTYSEETACR